MDKLIRAIDKKEHALLEAPTGCGKTLALLCGALAWQTKFIAAQGIDEQADQLALQQLGMGTGLHFGTLRWTLASSACSCTTNTQTPTCLDGRAVTLHPAQCVCKAFRCCSTLRTACLWSRFLPALKAQQEMCYHYLTWRWHAAPSFEATQGADDFATQAPPVASCVQSAVAAGASTAPGKQCSSPIKPGKEGQSKQDAVPAVAQAVGTAQKAPVCRIYYTTRTHSQIAQVCMPSFLHCCNMSQARSDDVSPLLASTAQQARDSPDTFPPQRHCKLIF